MALQHRAQVEEFRRKHRTGLLTLVFTDIVGSTAPDRAQVEEFRRKHPTGLLTLMFTDIVGSTALKQGLGEREVASLFQLLVMRAFTDRHRPLRAAHAAVRQAARGQPHHSSLGSFIDPFVFGAGLPWLHLCLDFTRFSWPAVGWIVGGRLSKQRPHETVTKISHMKNAAKIPTYRVWGMDSVVYGAVDLPGLIQWIRDERVTADQWVFAEHDNRWQKAADWPELQATLRSKPKGGVTGAAAVGKGGHSLGVKPEALRRMKCFANMDDPQIESFVRYMELIHCEQFSHIVRSGELGDAMYLVLEGELRALAMVDGKEVTLGTIHVGESFGEISLIDKGPRSADVVANKDSVLLKISSAAFAQVLREAPALPAPFLLALSRAVVGRVRSITKRYVDSVTFIRAAQKAR